jgi:hypothetical protein
MKTQTARWRLALVGLTALAAGLAWWAGGPPPSRADDANAEITRLRAEIDQLKGRLPSQSHAMMDVGYHFSNL